MSNPQSPTGTLKEIMAELSVSVDDATLDRWLVKFSPLIAANAQARKRPTVVSWRMDAPYIIVQGKWTSLYRAIDHKGKTLDFTLSERRDTVAVRCILQRAIGTDGLPDRVVIDKSGANIAGRQSVNVILKFTGADRIIKILQVKYIHDILEQPSRGLFRVGAESYAKGFSSVFWPPVFAGEENVCPFEGRDVGKKICRGALAFLFSFGCGLTEVEGVPMDNDGCKQV